MHSSSYLTTIALAATSVLARPAPVLSEASSVIQSYAAEATATIGDYIETGISDATIDEVTETYYEAAQPQTSGGIINSVANGNGSLGGVVNNGGLVNGGNNQQPEECMSREEAVKVAATFQSIIQGYTIEQAMAALTPDFVDYSSAVSIIINKGGSGPEDITAPIFTTRDEFMKGHGTQESIPFETLKVWSTCDGVVSMVWRSIRSGMGQENEAAAIPVTGTAILETEPTSMSEGEERERAEAGGYKYRINTLWSEFNTAAWLVNNGVLNLPPNVPAFKAPEEEVTASPPSTIQKRGPVTSKFDVGMA